jgi:hypothetical protein
MVFAGRSSATFIVRTRLQGLRKHGQPVFMTRLDHATTRISTRERDAATGSAMGRASTASRARLG